MANTQVWSTPFVVRLKQRSMRYHIFWARSLAWTPHLAQVHRKASTEELYRRRNGQRVLPKTYIAYGRPHKHRARVSGSCSVYIPRKKSVPKLKLPCPLTNDRDRINSLAETARETKDLISSTSAQSTNLVQGVDDKVCALLVSMKNDVQSSSDKILRHVGDVGIQVAAVEHAIQNQIHVQSDMMTNDITRQLKDLYLRIQDAFSTGLTQHNDLMTSLRQRVATSDQVDQLSQRVHGLSSQAKAQALHEQAHASAGQVDELTRMFQASPLLKQDQQPVSLETRPSFAPSSTIVSGTGSDRPLLSDILRDLFIVLSSDLADVFTRALVALIRHLHNLIHAWPQLLVLWQVMQRLPPAISLALHDNITFEDVLGRIHSLQYQQFKHWRVFKENLEHSFKGLPGSKEVRTGQFRLTNAKMPDKIYDKSNWSRKLQPGSSLVMSIIVDGLSHEYHQCPRCETKVSGTKERRHFCVRCKLHWEIFKAAGTSVSPDDWLFRHRVFAEPMTPSGCISPEYSMHSTNLRHLHTRRKRSQPVFDELRSFKRIHVKEPAAKLENVLGSRGWGQSAEAVEGEKVSQDSLTSRCNLCPRIFDGKYRRDHLRRHLKSVHGNQVIICELCCRSFKYRTDHLTKHFRRVHPGHLPPVRGYQESIQLSGAHATRQTS
jgi:hypothetical protein